MERILKLGKKLTLYNFVALTSRFDEDCIVDKIRQIPERVNR